MELARAMGGPESVARQHAGGKLTVRERIDRLLDPGSFHEVGALTGKANYDAGRLASIVPSNFVLGTGRIDGRRVVVGGDDFTVRGGAADAAIANKQGSTVPWVSVIVRRVFGVAGAAHGNAQRLNFRYAWPSGDWGSLPIEGGVQAAYRRDIESSPEEARRRELEAKLEALRSPFRTAEAFGIEEIIDPRDTRPLLCDWVAMAYDVLPAELGPKRRGCRP